MEKYYVCVKAQKKKSAHNLSSKLFSHIQEICLDIATVKLYQKKVFGKKSDCAMNIKDLSV